MEKQRNKSVSESCRRLLKKLFAFAVLFFSAGVLFSQTLTSAMARELRISPAQGQQLCVNSEIKFEVIIPYTLPGQIDVSMPDEKENISFRTLRKVESNGGTKIEIWFLFSKTGTYTLNPLVVKIKNSRRQLQFSPVTIGINPKEQQPLCYIVTSGGRNRDLTVQAGQKISFKVCLQYAQQLVKFSWDIPKDSIFVQGREYEFTEIKQREKTVTDELIPVCDFEWTPLVPGTYSFPVFNITAVAYNGDRVDVRMPQIKVTVVNARAKNTAAPKQYFSDAFEEDEAEQFRAENPSAVFESEGELAKTLASLRSKERHAVLPGARKARVEYEKALGLPYNQNEFALIWVYLSAVLFAAVLVLLIILLRLKKHNLCIAAGVGLICSLVIFIYTCVMTNRKFGVAGECTLYSIPENSASVKSELPAGNRVQIISESDGWVYVRFGETEGWCQKDCVIILR